MLHWIIISMAHPRKFLNTEKSWKGCSSFNLNVNDREPAMIHL